MQDLDVQDLDGYVPSHGAPPGCCSAALEDTEHCLGNADYSCRDLPESRHVQSAAAILSWKHKSDGAEVLPACMLHKG